MIFTKYNVKVANKEQLLSFSVFKIERVGSLQFVTVSCIIVIDHRRNTIKTNPSGWITGTLSLKQIQIWTFYKLTL